MQAIILAAGMGKRLGELTKDNTKCMIKVNGVTLIDRVLKQLSNLHLNKIVLVIGYQGEQLKQYIGNSYRNTPIEYVFNPIFDKTNNIYSLYLAKDHLQQDDTILLESDLIVEDKLFDKLLNNPFPNLALVAKYESWMDGTVVRLDEDNNIASFIPKKAFKYSDTQYYYKTVNMYKFSKEFSCSNYVPFLEAYSKALGNNEYYEQVLRVITLLDRCEFKALPLENEKWYEIDDIQDLDIAETIFSEGDIKLAKYQKRYGGYWRFPEMLDFCYLVNPYFPSPRMKEELKANFDILLTEYPSGMFVNSQLIAKYFGINTEYVCAGNGAAELIKSIMENLKGKLGLIYPTFEEYPHRIQSDKLITFTPNNSDFTYTEEELINYFSDKELTTLCLINPDNPSGNFIPLKDIIKLIEWSQKKNQQIIIDESFVDFAEGYPNNTLLRNDLLKKYPNLIVIKSISKSYGVPGLRLGILATSNPEIITKVRKDVSIWNINSFAEYYLQIFGKYESDYNVACHKFIAERNRFMENLKEIPFLRLIPSSANYFLCEITNKYTAKELTLILLNQYNILIKDCSSKTSFEGKNYIRIAIRNQYDNNRLIQTLKTLSK
mgnify:CR=1 FL=1